MNLQIEFKNTGIHLQPSSFLFSNIETQTEQKDSLYFS